MSKQNEKYKFSIVVPCYNEEKNIPILVERFKNFIENENILIVLVNNGSSDGSKALIEDLVKTYNFLTFVHIEKNIGYGNFEYIPTIPKESHKVENSSKEMLVQYLKENDII